MVYRGKVYVYRVYRGSSRCLGCIEVGVGV